MAKTILMIDDEAAVREAIRMTLAYEGYAVEEATSGQEGIERATVRDYDAILLDIKMPILDGIEVLDNLAAKGIRTPVIMVSGHGDIQTAVDCTRRGAFDFLEKPLNRDRLLLAVRNAIRQNVLEDENFVLRRKTAKEYRIIGDSEKIVDLRKRIEKAAPTRATVLVEGESGTGKELVAREIHRLSSRASGPFVQVNCAAIPEELIESELFGHEKGSFTGAIRKQVGKFLAADQGTIFLDEVGDMSLKTQAKVLRVLQEGEVEPVGAEGIVRVDVRVVAATNKDLEKEIAAGRFREDLYYRLNVIPIKTPSLRERAEDIPLLVEHFAQRFSEEHNYRRKQFTSAAIDAFREAPLRGNVRELQNLVERLIIMGPDDEIDVGDLPAGLFSSSEEVISGALGVKTLQEFKDEAEKRFILARLRENGWNVSRTAEAIETPRSNLYKKIEQYGLRREGVSVQEDP